MSLSSLSDYLSDMVCARISRIVGRMMNRMSELDIIIFAIAGVVIILFSLYVVISMTQDIDETICECEKIGVWAKNELERRTE